MPLDTLDTPAFTPLPIRDPRPRTLWIALAILMFVIMLAGMAVVAAVAGTPVPFLPSGTDSEISEAGLRSANGSPLPKIEPVEYLAVPPATAKQINDAVAFTTDPVPAAAPLHLSFATPADQQRAIDCLAAAVWYEAGNDSIGQSAVAQVVINRMRHGAFIWRDIGILLYTFRVIIHRNAF